MRYVLFTLFLCTSYWATGQRVPVYTYTVDYCPPIEPAKKQLTVLVKQIHSEKQLPRLLNQWAKEYRLAEAFVILQRSDGYYYRWHNRHRAGGGLFKENIKGLIGGNRPLVKPEEDLLCFFADTLVVVDTLLFKSGLPPSYRFYIHTKSKDVQIPLDSATGHLSLSAHLLDSSLTGQYIPFSVEGQYREEPRRVLTTGALYFFTTKERSYFIDALHVKAGKSINSCDVLIAKGLSLLFAVWGGKRCDQNELYRPAQQLAVKTILKQRKIVCQ